MYKCNLLIVYLEQYRDIYNKDIETEFFEEQIKKSFVHADETPASAKIMEEIFG